MRFQAGVKLVGKLLRGVLDGILTRDIGRHEDGRAGLDREVPPSGSAR